MERAAALYLNSYFMSLSALLPVIRLWLEEYGDDFHEPPQHPALRLLCVHLRRRLCFRRLAQTAESLLKRLQERGAEEEHDGVLMMGCRSISNPVSWSFTNVFCCFCWIDCSRSLSQRKDDESPQWGSREQEDSGETSTKEEDKCNFMDFAVSEVAEQLTRLDAVSFPYYRASQS